MRVKISFGMIVLNGQPFLKYNLRSLYPFAHEILVVEGAAPAAATAADKSGHSTDGTLEALREFKEQEDPENKLTILTAEDEGHSDGFWPGEKDEMSQAYAGRARGDYLWQVDADEFYTAEGMNSLCRHLEANPDITAVSFPMITFWGDPWTQVDGWYLRRGANIYHRLFRWGASYTYSTHRPPTVLDPEGVDTRSISHLKASHTRSLGVYLYHYSLLFPKQVEEKNRYYQHVAWSRRDKAVEWTRTCYHEMKCPYRVHNVYRYPSWLEPYRGEVPVQVFKMWRAVQQGHVEITQKEMQKEYELMASTWYQAGAAVLKILDYVFRPFAVLRQLEHRVRSGILRRLRRFFTGQAR